MLETHPARAKSPPRYALRTEDRKVIWFVRERRHEYYDLRADPAERHDLGESAPSIYGVLAEDLDLELREQPVISTRTIDDDAGGMSQETQDALRALGYVD
jgi:hypothetical protein